MLPIDGDYDGTEVTFTPTTTPLAATRVAPAIEEVWQFSDDQAGKLLRESVPGTNYILDIDDPGKRLAVEPGAAAVVTVPTTASVAIPVDSVIVVTQDQAEQVDIAAAPGVTFKKRVETTLTLAGENSTVVLIKEAGDVWLVSGDFTDTSSAYLRVAIAINVGTVNGDAFPFQSIEEESSGDFTVDIAGGTVTVQRAGAYLASGVMSMRSDNVAANPLTLGFSVLVNGTTIGSCASKRWSKRRERLCSTGWLARCCAGSRRCRVAHPSRQRQQSARRRKSQQALTDAGCPLISAAYPLLALTPRLFEEVPPVIPLGPGALAVADLVAWFQSTAATVTSGDRVLNWPDSGIFGNDLAAANNAQRATFEPGWRNGLPGIRGRAATRLDSAAFGTPVDMPGSVYIVGRSGATALERSCSSKTGKLSSRRTTQTSSRCLSAARLKS